MTAPAHGGPPRPPSLAPGQTSAVARSATAAAACGSGLCCRDDCMLTGAAFRDVEASDVWDTSLRASTRASRCRRRRGCSLISLRQQPWRLRLCRARATCAASPVLRSRMRDCKAWPRRPEAPRRRRRKFWLRSGSLLLRWRALAPQHAARHVANLPGGGGARGALVLQSVLAACSRPRRP